jgi:hypothetical protein
MRTELKENVSLTIVQVLTLLVLSFILGLSRFNWQALGIAVVFLIPFLFITRERTRYDVLFLSFILATVFGLGFVPADLQRGGGVEIFYWIFIALFVLMVYILDHWRDRRFTLVLTFLIGLFFFATTLFIH